MKNIKTIDYSWGEITFESSPMRGAMLCESMRKAGDSLDMDIESDDIEVSDMVTVVWEMA